MLGHYENVVQTIEARHVLVCTGAVPRAIPGVAFDGDRIITSKEAIIAMKRTPDHLTPCDAAIVGIVEGMS